MLNSWIGWGRGMALAAALLALFTGRAGPAVALLVPLLPTLRTTGRRSGSPPPQRSHATLTLLTANLYKANHRAGPHIALIREHEPDVVMLQELTPGIAAAMIEAVGASYPHRLWHPEPGAYGYGILSRYPLVGAATWERPGVRPWCQRATVRVGETSIDLFNVHLLPPVAHSTLRMGLTRATRSREAQVTRVLDWIARHGRPAIVMGDMNFTAHNEAYRLMTAPLQDLWAGVGRGYGATWPGFVLFGRTMPVGWGLLRLDHAFVTPSLEARRAQVLRPRSGSDHHPLLVEVALP